MVIHSDRLSDKEQRQEIKGQEEVRQELRKPVLEEEKKIDFPVQGGRWETVHQTEEEANYRKGQERTQRPMRTSRGWRRILIRRRRWDGRPYIKWRKLKTMNSTGRE